MEDHFEIEGIDDFQKKFLEEFLEERRDIELIMVKAINPTPLKGSTQISVGFDMSKIIIFIIVKTRGVRDAVWCGFGLFLAPHFAVQFN